MNDKQKAYCDGAAMAYRDCAKKMDELINNSPAAIAEIMQGMRPFADAMRAKASEVYKEVERILGDRQ